MGKFSNGGLVELYKKIGLRDPKFFNGKSVVNLFKILGVEPVIKEEEEEFEPLDDKRSYDIRDILNKAKVEQSLPESDYRNLKNIYINTSLYIFSSRNVEYWNRYEFSFSHNIVLQKFQK